MVDLAAFLKLTKGKKTSGPKLVASKPAAKKTKPAAKKSAASKPKPAAKKPAAKPAAKKPAASKPKQAAKKPAASKPSKPKPAAKPAKKLTVSKPKPAKKLTVSKPKPASSPKFNLRFMAMHAGLNADNFKSGRVAAFCRQDCHSRGKKCNPISGRCVKSMTYNRYVKALGKSAPKQTKSTPAKPVKSTPVSKKATPVSKKTTSAAPKPAKSVEIIMVGDSNPISLPSNTFEVKHIRGDGNCFFRSVVQAIQYALRRRWLTEKQEEEQSRSLRQKASKLGVKLAVNKNSKNEARAFMKNGVYVGFEALHSVVLYYATNPKKDEPVVHITTWIKNGNTLIRGAKFPLENGNLGVSPTAGKKQIEINLLFTGEPGKFSYSNHYEVLYKPSLAGPKQFKRIEKRGFEAKAAKPKAKVVAMPRAKAVTPTPTLNAWMGDKKKHPKFHKGASAGMQSRNLAKRFPFAVDPDTLPLNTVRKTSRYLYKVVAGPVKKNGTRGKVWKRASQPNKSSKKALKAIKIRRALGQYMDSLKALTLPATTGKDLIRKLVEEKITKEEGVIPNRYLQDINKNDEDEQEQVNISKGKKANKNHFKNMVNQYGKFKNMPFAQKQALIDTRVRDVRAILEELKRLEPQVINSRTLENKLKAGRAELERRRAGQQQQLANNALVKKMVKNAFRKAIDFNGNPNQPVAPHPAPQQPMQPKPRRRIVPQFLGPAQAAVAAGRQAAQQAPSASHTFSGLPALSGAGASMFTR